MDILDDAEKLSEAFPGIQVLALKAHALPFARKT